MFISPPHAPAEKLGATITNFNYIIAACETRMGNPDKNLTLLHAENLTEMRRDTVSVNIQPEFEVRDAVSGSLRKLSAPESIYRRGEMDLARNYDHRPNRSRS